VTTKQTVYTLTVNGTCVGTFENLIDARRAMGFEYESHREVGNDGLVVVYAERLFGSTKFTGNTALLVVTTD